VAGLELPVEKNYLVWRLNRAIALMPLETMASLMLLEGTSFWINKALLMGSGVHIPALYAVAFALSMPLRRSILPKLAVAMPLTLALSRLMPSLTRVRLSLVFGSLRLVKQKFAPQAYWEYQKQQHEEDKQDRRQELIEEAMAKKDRAAARRAAVEPLPPPEKKASHRLLALSDKYGLALWVSYRMAGFVLINATYAALLYGVDVTAVLAWLGYTGDLQSHSVVATYAAAVSLSAVWFPLTVVLAPYPAELLHRIRMRYFSSAPNRKAIRLFAPVRRDAMVEADIAAATAEAVRNMQQQQPQQQPQQQQQQSQKQQQKSGSDASKSGALLLLLTAVGAGASAAAAAETGASEDAKTTSPAATPLLTASASVSFRPATAADLPAIVRLLVEDELGSQREVNAAQDAPVAPCYQEAWSAIEADPNSEVLVGVSTESGAVVACLQLTCIPNLTLQGTTRALIEGVRVAASLRGQQVGRALFEYAEERARLRGATLMQLTTNVQRPGAAQFYARVGYAASHVGFKKALP